MPMMYIVLPKLLQQKFPTLVTKLKGNQHRLTTAFDIWQTLLDIIALNNDKRQIQSGHGVSLLSEVPRGRTCMDVAVPTQYCTCEHEEEVISVNNSLAKQGAHFLVHEMNIMLKDSSELCAELKLQRIYSAITFNFNDDFKAYKLKYITTPGLGKFDGTFKVRHQNNDDKKEESMRKPIFYREGHITRRNSYHKQSLCVKHQIHKLYCYCKDENRK